MSDEGNQQEVCAAKSLISGGEGAASLKSDGDARAWNRRLGLGRNKTRKGPSNQQSRCRSVQSSPLHRWVHNDF